jgi:hypothetical protein
MGISAYIAVWARARESRGFEYLPLRLLIVFELTITSWLVRLFAGLPQPSQR